MRGRRLHEALRLPWTRRSTYLKEAGMEVQLFEGVEPDPSVETVMKGAAAMREPSSPTGSSPWAAVPRSTRPRPCGSIYEYPEITFEDMMQGLRLAQAAQEGSLLRHPLHLRHRDRGDCVLRHHRLRRRASSTRSPTLNITPDVAIVDPDLAETMPKKLVAHTGMDAMTHAIEAYVSTAQLRLHRSAGAACHQDDSEPT